MKSSIIGSFLLILLVVSCATAEKVDQTSEIESRIVAENGASNGDKFHKKRSITNIMKLLLGGNVPPNHPLVKESEPKSWNLAPQILASLPGSGYGLGGGWGPTPAQKLQQIFETKAKILPYTGQVASGLIGIGGVKGEILKQIHGLSTSVIANVAAEAAQKAVRTALAAQAVTNQVAHATPHILNAAGQAIHSAKAAKGELLRPLIPHANGYANFGVGLGHHHDLHQGWHSTQQNSFALPNSGSAGDKTPGDLPGPPYSSQSVQTQLYQAPAYQNSYSAAASAVPSTSSPDYGQAAMYNMQQNGQQQESASEPQQTQDYNELVNQITNDARNRLNAIDYSTLAQQLQLQQQQQQRPGQNYGPPKPQGYNPSPPPPSQIYNPISTNNANTTSFHSAVSDESWRKYSGNVQETPSILSSIAQIAASSISAYKSLSTIADVSTTAARKSSTVAGDATLSGSAPTPTGFAGQYQPSPHQLGGFSSRPHYAQSPQPIRHYQTQSPHLYAASSSSRAQYVPHNVAKYSPQALRNTPNAHRLHDASVKLGSNLLRRPTATIQSGHYDAGVGSSLGSLSRFSPQPTRSYVDQTTRSFGAGRAIHTHAGPTARNFVGASRTYPGSIAQTSPFTVGGQTQNLFGSASNFAPTSAGGQRYASPRENREQSAYSLSGYRSPYLTSHLHSASSSSTNHNYHQLAPSPSEQSLNYELPPTTSSHSQYNNIGQSSLGGRSVLTAKKVNGPATVTRDDSRPQFQSRISERFPSSKERSVEDISLTNEEVEDSSEKLPRLHLHQTATFPKGGSVSAASSRSSSEVVSPPQNRISSGESTNRSFKPQSPTYPEQDPEFTPPSRDNYFMSDRMDQQEPSSQEDTSQEHQIYDLYQHHPVMPMEQPEANHQSREKISKEEVELKREAIFKIPDRRVPPATKAVKEMTERSSKSQKELQDEERKKSLSELIQQLIKLLK
ncbi:uncharacterized protein LOC110862616 isoform X2 [Folsomia candida]|uniref:uncharacterized protein LOC110862616 isoform X2 n=1 Tax=Folsomia candida TaxID=158441 RepID=UPI001604AAEB|nr:uncharacterized protein LOC110862616 isoform X2 [Folsomia candida]